MSTHPGDQDLGPPPGNGARLSCLGFVDLLDDYIEGALSPARRQTFDSHLATCPDCPNYLDAYRKTIELGRSAVLAGDEIADVELPPELIPTILSTLGSGS